jgi:hypothetical protein
MTDARFEAMNEREQRELAQRLADASETYDFETALQIVRARPLDAESMLRDREKRKKLWTNLPVRASDADWPSAKNSAKPRPAPASR